MGGIGNYFHGERGEVDEVFYVAAGDMLYFDMSLRGDPHRRVAHDYGSDIGIDPSIRRGERVTYVRLSEWAGLWVREGEEHTPRVGEALDRCRDHRARTILPYGRHRWKRWLGLRPVRGERDIPFRKNGPTDDRPRTELSLFLSYARDDVLLARDFREFLTKEAALDVWLDLYQPSQPVSTDEEVTAWLRQAVYGTRLFLLLLTRSAQESKWVRSEVEWATAKQREQPDFQVLFLNLADLDFTPPRSSWVLDCRTLSMGEILEETYARIYGYTGRRQWLAAEPPEERSRRTEPPTVSHWAAGEAGVAIDLSVDRRGGELRWTLRYEKNGSEKIARGRGDSEVVDLGIRRGDRIASTVFQHRYPLWMRSQELSLTTYDVYRVYTEAVREAGKAAASRRRSGM